MWLKKATLIIKTHKIGREIVRIYGFQTLSIDQVFELSPLYRIAIFGCFRGVSSCISVMRVRVIPFPLDEQYLGSQLKKWSFVKQRSLLVHLDRPVISSETSSYRHAGIY